MPGAPLDVCTNARRSSATLVEDLQAGCEPPSAGERRPAPLQALPSPTRATPRQAEGSWRG